jgi:hypothetical protein
MKHSNFSHYLVTKEKALRVDDIPVKQTFVTLESEIFSIA